MNCNVPSEPLTKRISQVKSHHRIVPVAGAPVLAPTRRAVPEDRLARGPGLGSPNPVARPPELRSALVVLLGIFQDPPAADVAIARPRDIAGRHLIRAVVERGCRLVITKASG